jgi:hypothetical protein
MNEDIHLPESDPVDDLLASRPGPASAALRQSILGRTAGVLRRRRWTRRAAWAALLAACYAVGVLTPRPWAGPTPAPPPEVTRTLERPPEPPPQPPSVPPAEGSALALEWRAVEADVGRADLFRRAGQRYLREEGDPLGAVRCYAHALEKPAAGDLTVRLDDDWLLMALKDARQKEIQNAAPAH